MNLDNIVENAAPIVGAASSALGSISSGLFGNYQAKKQFERQKELMKMSNEMNIANWQMENEYNTPKNQIARLREAGINPDLFYGSSSANTLGAEISSAPTGSASMANPLQTDFGQSTLQGMMVDAHIKNLESQTRKNNADAGYVEEQTPWVSKQIQSTLNLNAENTKVLNEQVEKIRSENELLKWQSLISKNEYQIRDALKDSEISKSLAENKLSEKQSSVIMDNFASLYTAQIRLAVAQAYASYVNADANASNASTNRSRLQLDTVIQHSEVSVKRAQLKLNKSMNEAGIQNMNLQNEWRRMLKDVPIIGDAVHGLLSVPGSWFGTIAK